MEVAGFTTGWARKRTTALVHVSAVSCPVPMGSFHAALSSLSLTTFIELPYRRGYVDYHTDPKLGNGRIIS